MAEPNIELRGILQTVRSEFGFAFRPRLSNLTLSSTVNDAYTRLIYNVPVSQDICFHQHPTALEVAETMRSTMREFYEHEIDEALVIEGLRPFNPHCSENMRAEIQDQLRKIVY